MRDSKGVDPDKKVRGTDWYVTQPFPVGGLGALQAPQRGPGRSPGGKRILEQMFWKFTQNQVPFRSPSIPRIPIQ